MTDPSDSGRERYRFADLCLDVPAVRVTRSDGAELALPQLSFELLVALVRRAPDMVTTEELIATVWAGVAISDETLTQRIALLRRALGDDARQPRYVRAVRGRGYQLIPPLEAADPTPVQTSSTRRARPLRLALVAGAVLLSLGLGLAWWVGSTPRATPETVGAQTRPAGVEELVARADSLLGRHSRGDNELAIELYGKALATAPDHVRALAGLALAHAQRATKFNFPLEETREAVGLARRALVLEPSSGRAHHALALALDAQGRVEGALEEYLEAARLDPTDRGAALASAAHLLAVRGQLAAALERNLEALATGESLPYLEVQIGTVLARLGFLPQAEVWYQKALDLRPDNVFAAAAFAELRLAQGRTQEADALAAAALARGVARPELALSRGLAALLADRPQEAQRWFDEALRIRPGQGRATVLSLVLARRVDGSSALRTLEPRYEAMVRELEADRANGNEWPDPAFEAALLHAAWERQEDAFEALDAAIQLGYRNADWLQVDPWLSSLGNRAALLERVERIRGLVAAERQRVLGAPWLPPGLLASPKAASAAST